MKQQTKTLTEKQSKKGHMALRNNVYDLKLELWKVLKPLEYFLVDLIIDKTIKWRTDEAVIKIEELMERTGQKHTHIYTALKKLEKLGVITRRKVAHNLVIGLNKEYFGGLLIKRHEDALKARKNKIKVVVDNSKPPYETRTKIVPNPYQPGTNPVQKSNESRTTKHDHASDIIQENAALNTFFKDTSIKTSLKDKETKAESRESFTLLGTGTEGNPRSQQLDDPVKEKERQFRMARLAGIAI